MTIARRGLPGCNRQSPIVNSYWIFCFNNLRATTFAALRTGDRVNVEVDALTLAVVETVERVLADR